VPLAAATAIPAVPSAIAAATTGLATASVSPELAAFGMLVVVFGVPAFAILAFKSIGERSFHGNAFLGWLRLLLTLYTRYFQRLTVEGAELVPQKIGPEGLIVVSTHAAGLDPVSIQAQTPVPIRWMMSAEMMDPALGWFWRRLRIIPVTFDSRDASALKTAIAHVSAGGALGIFPEGAIERPPRQLRPFSGGLRLILSRTRAPVLVAAIDPGIPTDHAYDALFRPTYPKVRFLALVRPGPEGHGRDAAERIFELLREKTGWPVTDVELPPPDRATVDRNLAAYLGRANGHDTPHG
jgi:1-acyl-sn-glycerol-3-phosphate acyltransferase